MLDSTKKILRHVLKGSRGMNILEIGGGLISTPFLRRVARRSGGFHCVLESDKKWYNILAKRIPDGAAGRLVFAPIIVDDRGCSYNHELSGTFDVVLIDGPSPISESDQRKFSKYIKNTCLAGYDSGAVSASLLDYVIPHLSNRCSIVVDGRLASVLHYVSYPEFSHRFYGKKYNKRKISKLLRPEFRRLVKLPLSYTTLLYKG